MLSHIMQIINNCYSYNLQDNDTNIDILEYIQHPSYFTNSGNRNNNTSCQMSYPPLLRLSLDYYSLVATLALLGAWVLNLSLCACLMRPPTFYDRSVHRELRYYSVVTSQKTSRVCISTLVYCYYCHCCLLSLLSRQSIVTVVTAVTAVYCHCCHGSLFRYVTRITTMCISRCISAPVAYRCA